MAKWGWCLLPAGMKWRLVAFSPDLQIMVEKPSHQRRISVNRRHPDVIRAVKLGVGKTVSFNGIVFPCMCVMKKDWMYNIESPSPSVCLPPQRSHCRTHLWEFCTPGLEECFTSTLTMLCVCCCAVLPTPRHSSVLSRQQPKHPPLTCSWMLNPRDKKTRLSARG